MVTAPQAAIPPARKPRAAEGFFVGGETFVVMGLLTKDDAGVVGEGRNAGGEDDDAILCVDCRVESGEG